MDRASFRSIDGIETFWKYFPDVEWFHFHDIVEFRWFHKYDGTEMADRWYVELTMADYSGEDIVKFVFIDANIASAITMRGYISGLEILNRCTDFQRSAYEISDFEEDTLNIFCSDISIEVLQAQGRVINKDVENDEFSGSEIKEISGS